GNAGHVQDGHLGAVVLEPLAEPTLPNCHEVFERRQRWRAWYGQSHEGHVAENSCIGKHQNGRDQFPMPFVSGIEHIPQQWISEPWRVVQQMPWLLVVTE